MFASGATYTIPEKDKSIIKNKLEQIGRYVLNTTITTLAQAGTIYTNYELIKNSIENPSLENIMKNIALQTIITGVAQLGSYSINKIMFQEIRETQEIIEEKKSLIETYKQRNMRKVHDIYEEKPYLKKWKENHAHYFIKK